MEGSNPVSVPPERKARAGAHLLSASSEAQEERAIANASNAEKASFSSFILLHAAESSRRQTSVGSQTSLVPQLTKLLDLLSFLSCFPWFLSWSLIKITLVTYPGFPPALPHRTPPTPLKHTLTKIFASLFPLIDVTQWGNCVNFIIKVNAINLQQPSRSTCSCSTWCLLATGCGSSERFFQAPYGTLFPAPLKVTGWKQVC